MIELNHLSVGYSGRPVLEDVNLAFRPGEVTVLVGPNGCGKSTLIRTVLGLQPALGGEILVDGVSAAALSPKEQAKAMAYLAQSRPVPNIKASRMVLHGRFPYLSYPRRYRAEDYTAVENALERANATDLADRLVGELSGGERQRVYLAMALAQDTPTVFLDEPTTYLDVRHQLEVMEMAHTLAAEGKAVVLVLHDLCLALRTAHRMAVLADGRLRYFGEPEEAYSSGILEQVFGVNLLRARTEDGWRYYYG